MIPLPSPNSDPTGLAALVGVLATAIVVALGVDGAWGPVIGAAVPLLAIVAARFKAYAPDSHDAAVDVAIAADRAGIAAQFTPGGTCSTDIGPFERPPPVVGPGHEGPLT